MVADSGEERKRFRLEMYLAFETACLKAIRRGERPGNSMVPWDDFTQEHLENRLKEEVDEYFEGPNSQELCDIMNMAAFLFVQRLHKRVDELEE